MTDKEEPKRKKKTLADIFDEAADDTVEKVYFPIIPESEESTKTNKAILKCFFSTLLKAKAFEAMTKSNEETES